MSMYLTIGGCVHLSVCVCICMYVYMYVCMYLCLSVSACLFALSLELLEPSLSTIHPKMSPRPADEVHLGKTSAPSNKACTDTRIWQLADNMDTPFLFLHNNSENYCNVTVM